MRSVKEKMRIVVVDDDEEDVELVKRALSQLDYDIDCVHSLNGRDLLETLEYSKDHYADPFPDLVLLDLNMPVLNGMATLQRLREHPEFCKIPVVVFSTSKDPSDVNAAYRSGANSFVAKPVSLREYTNAIREIVTYWRNTVQLPT